MEMKMKEKVKVKVKVKLKLKVKEGIASCASESSLWIQRSEAKNTPFFCFGSDS